MHFHIPFRHAITLFIAILLCFPSVAFAQDSTPESVFGIDPNAPCGESRLRVGDLQDIDDTIADGIARATEEAREWQKDARIYLLRLSCPLLVTGVKWEGVFFSESAQALYETDTGKVEPVEVDPELIPTLVPEQIRMRVVYDALIDYGFTDELMLTVNGGVTIRVSTSQLPFGPPSAPNGHMYAHVAVERQHEILDVWIDMRDGRVYTYFR